MSEMGRGKKVSGAEIRAELEVVTKEVITTHQAALREVNSELYELHTAAINNFKDFISAQSESVHVRLGRLLEGRGDASLDELLRGFEGEFREALNGSLEELKWLLTEAGRHARERQGKFRKELVGALVAEIERVTTRQIEVAERAEVPAVEESRVGELSPPVVSQVLELPDMTEHFEPLAQELSQLREELKVRSAHQFETQKQNSEEILAEIQRFGAEVLAGVSDSLLNLKSEDAEGKEVSLQDSIDVISTKIQEHCSQLQESFERRAASDSKVLGLDDFDLRMADLRDTVDLRGKRWQFQENIFYGLVLILLMVNMGMILWLVLNWR